MPSSTLTSKGQLTLPKVIRERLKVHTGDTVDFIVGDDGDIRVRAGTHDVKDLRGILQQRQRASLDLSPARDVRP